MIQDQAGHAPSCTLFLLAWLAMRHAEFCRATQATMRSSSRSIGAAPRKTGREDRNPSSSRCPGKDFERTAATVDAEQG